MAITPRSKGLGNIGAIVDRQGRASPAMKAPVKPVVKAAPKPVAKPAARVAPKPAPKMAPAPKPSPFKNQQQPITAGTGQLPPGFGAPSPIDRSQLGGAQRVGGPVNKPIIGGPRPGRDPEFADMPDDLYNSMMAYNKSRDDQMQAAKAAGDPYWFAIPETADIKPWHQWQMDKQERLNPSPPPNYNMPPQPVDIGNENPYMPPEPYIPPNDMLPPGYQYNGPPPMDPGYGGPYMPRPDMGPDVGFGPGLPQPGMGPQPGAPDYAFSGDGYNPGEPPGYQPPMTQPGQGGPFGQLNQQLGNTFVDMFTRRLPAMYGGGQQPNFGSNFGAPGQGGQQPKPAMQDAFRPQSNFGGGGFMGGGGSGSLFGGGGFAGK
jgi:hypothetical protein